MNSSSRAKLMAFAGIALFGGMIRQAVADEWNQKTTFTFREPVENPARSCYPARTYSSWRTHSPTATSFRCSVRMRSTCMVPS
jgi:hypothetical protein